MIKILCYMLTMFILCTFIVDIKFLYDYDIITEKEIDKYIFFNITIGSIVFLLYGDKITPILSYGSAPKNFEEKILKIPFNKNEVIATIYTFYFLLILTTTIVSLFSELDSFFKAIISAFAVFAAFEKALDKYQKVQ